MLSSKPPFPDLRRVVNLPATDCLEMVEYLTRQSRAYGLEGDLDVSRSMGLSPASDKTPYGKHYVLCRAAESPSWVMQLLLTDRGENQTGFALGLSRFRRARSGIVDGRLAADFVALVSAGLDKAVEPVSISSNVVPLRRYAPIHGGRSLSA